MMNLNDGEWTHFANDAVEFERKTIGQLAGGKQLGASLFRLKPGKKAFPFHYHYANEEAILVIEGEGSLRLGDKTKSIKQDDYIALPTGADHAHQVINTSEYDLVYLCLSTMIEPEVMVYPDSDKIGMMAGTPPGGKKNDNSEKSFFKQDDHCDYYKDEK
jgi:uncharacterized cupin superfamily protein